jgi:hypothetical protein
MVLRAGIPGLLVAVALTGDGLVSVQIWLAVAAVWVAGTLLWDLIAVAAVEPDRRMAAWRISGWRRPRRTAHGPARLRTLNLLLVNAQTNPRAHANAFRPRLIGLAEHYIPIRHGFDLEHEPVRVTDLLGNVAWLIDPTVNDRTPTSSEIGRFLDLVLAEEDERTSARRVEGQVEAT